ncbi:hypothetical protein EUGRSUZ_J00339 [Eucalyptus grandis]|uniref:Uncharacterized protein n=2 Tax=Eucalyptus grandis TaxID=71139 RepID=A0ACC3J1H4_EUCGR|nr:hypothetical protein EUGRSUZ_J00339 [Eucalyptus grandis]
MILKVFNLFVPHFGFSQLIFRIEKEDRESQDIAQVLVKAVAFALKTACLVRLGKPEIVPPLINLDMIILMLKEVRLACHLRALPSAKS